MCKLRVDEPVLPDYSTRLLLFQQLCLLPRVDPAAFARAARSAKILAIVAGQPPGSAGYTVSADFDSRNASMDALAPLYAAALRSIEGHLTELDLAGLDQGIKHKWTICGVSFNAI